MGETSLKFGTSGLRGLVTDLEGQATRRYTAAFLQYLRDSGRLGGNKVYIGRDFRPSSPAIAQDCAVAIAVAGLEAIDCGTLPTPALALHAMAAGGAAIMVTGSHIPVDRNGLKFYGPFGEISKVDEACILEALRDEPVMDREVAMQDEAGVARHQYLERFAALLPPGTLAGLKIGVFEHSSVARDLLHDVLRHFGAETVSLGRQDQFVAVDTEAFGDAVFAPLAGWIAQWGLDAIVSADGDGDRPLLMDGAGAFVRGDVLGLLAARYLGARSVVTPVTSNSAIEQMGFFPDVIRTRVGSPFVVGAMEGRAGMVGFEANGGTVVGEGIAVRGQPVPPLPTRDAILPILCALGLAAERQTSIATVVASLPLQHALANRLQDVPGERSSALLGRLAEDQAFAREFFAPHGIARVAAIDGLQFFLASGDMVHFRASGNAPELRCYVEAGTAERARLLLDWALDKAAAQVR